MVDFGIMKVVLFNLISMILLMEMKEIFVVIICEEVMCVVVKFIDLCDDFLFIEKVVMGNGFIGLLFIVFGLGMYNDKKIGVYVLVLFCI